jgi:hypothetical protein
MNRFVAQASCLQRAKSEKMGLSNHSHRVVHCFKQISKAGCLGTS